MGSNGSSQYAGVILLGIAGFFCVTGIVVVTLIATSGGSDHTSAISALGALGSAAVGGIAGMLTASRHGEPPAGAAK